MSKINQECLSEVRDVFSSTTHQYNAKKKVGGEKTQAEIIKMWVFLQLLH